MFFDKIILQLSEGQLLARLLLNLISVIFLTGFLYAKRYRRRDVILTLISLNTGIFTVLAVISTQQISTGVGFGLFGILSIIRLRSETVSNAELSYYLSSLVIGLINGFDQKLNYELIFLNVLILVVIYIADHPSMKTSVKKRVITIPEIVTDVAAIQQRLSVDLGIEIESVTITDIDYVREITKLDILYSDDRRYVNTVRESLGKAD